MKRFSEIQNVSGKINEADGANLPSNYEEMSKEELVKMLQGNTGAQAQAQAQEEREESEEDQREHVGEGSNPSKFFSKLFESREMAHIYHLQVNGEMGSHAKHTALNDYYEGVLDLIDSMIEVFQGQYGLVEEYDIIDTTDTKSKETIEYFNELANFIKVERKTTFNEEDTHLHNIIDEIVSLLYRTLYKLKYNK
jgi:hypothetical protein